MLFCLVVLFKGSGFMSYCLYFVATLLRKKIWFVSGLLRNEGRVALERSLDKEKNQFEFFVPPAQKERFLQLMETLQELGLVLDLKEETNRLLL
jgi:hypothetical protein